MSGTAAAVRRARPASYTGTVGGLCWSRGFRLTTDNTMRQHIAALVLVASMAVAFVAAVFAWVGLIGLTHLVITLAGAGAAGLAASKALTHD